MDKKILEVIVGKTPSGCGAYLPEVDGFVIASSSVKQLKAELRKALEFHIEGLEDYEIKEWMKGGYDFFYRFDIGTLLENYSDVLTQSAVARLSGVNESLMRQYSTGIKKPSKKQLQRIETALHHFAQEMSNISLA